MWIYCCSDKHLNWAQAAAKSQLLSAGSVFLPVPWKHGMFCSICECLVQSLDTGANLIKNRYKILTSFFHCESRIGLEKHLLDQSLLASSVCSWLLKLPPALFVWKKSGVTLDLCSLQHFRSLRGAVQALAQAWWCNFTGRKHCLVFNVSLPYLFPHYTFAVQIGSSFAPSSFGG